MKKSITGVGGEEPLCCLRAYLSGLSAGNASAKGVDGRRCFLPTQCAPGRNMGAEKAIHPHYGSTNLWKSLRAPAFGVIMVVRARRSILTTKRLTQSRRPRMPP